LVAQATDDANENVDDHAGLMARRPEGGSMIRHLGVVCSLAIGLASSAAPLLASDRALPMRFDLRQDAATTCAANCRLWIAATGAITAETPVEFRNFASGRDLKGATLVLDSDGGSVLGAIALGRDIRALGLATTVGTLTDVAATKPGAKSDIAPATFSPRADCESMCAFVLLAGVERSVAPEARVMVHQIWLGDRRDDPTAANYSAEDLVLVQRDIGRLAKYTADMGGPADLLELALRIPPWEPMHALTRAELRQMGFETQDGAPPRETPVASVSSVSYAPATAGNRADGVDEHGWSMIDHAGASVLGRRHPLTIEGEEIGSFDLLVACGDNDNYLVTYQEERRADIGASAAPLTDVTLRLSGRSAALKVVSSRLQDKSGMLTTVAVGTVPANLIKAFMTAGSHSMMIGTANEKTQSTIRVGNSGAHRSLPMLTAQCQQATAARAELVTPQATTVKR
jgi:hypothetical protein